MQTFPCPAAVIVPSALKLPLMVGLGWVNEWRVGFLLVVGQVLNLYDCAIGCLLSVAGCSRTVVFSRSSVVFLANIFHLSSSLFLLLFCSTLSWSPLENHVGTMFQPSHEFMLTFKSKSTLDPLSAFELRGSVVEYLFAMFELRASARLFCPQKTNKIQTANSTQQECEMLFTLLLALSQPFASWTTDSNQWILYR